jgi:hypothetical protein
MKNMKKQFFLFCGLIFVLGNLHAEDVTIGGNLDVQGNVLNLGSWEGQTNEAGLSLNYTDYPDDEVGEFRFSLNRNWAGWTWEHLGGNNVWKPAMRLSQDHSLVLYDSLNAWKVWLNPNGNSVFQNSLTINGNNNLMPNQSLSGDGSILTRKLGDGRYVVKESSSFSLGMGNSVIGQKSMALGNDISVSGSYSVALGYESVVSGTESVAIGNYNEAKGGASTAIGFLASANGMGSVAIGSDVAALGAYSVALGNSTASGSGSVSVGISNDADGYSSTALGYHNKAQGLYQTVVGVFNQPQGSPNNWVATDDLFVVGNGTSNNQRSNAFTVKKNGDAMVKGNATVQGYGYFNDINTDGITAGGDVMVSGVTEMMGGAYVQGAAHVQGDLQVTGKINVTPQGDLGMGTFK